MLCWKLQLNSNHICFLSKWIKFTSKDNMGQTVLPRDTNLSVIYQGERKELFTEPYWESLKGQDRSNGIVSWYKFTENFCKHNANLNISVFDKNWLKWRIRVITRIVRDWHLPRTFQSKKMNHLNHMCFLQKMIIFYETMYGPSRIIVE